jgi:phenylpropionate dioxygenase-like ring-hydroxylating dioxygenase large terminal subunit
MDDIDEGLRQRRPAHSLPGDFYHDPEIYQADLSRIWYRQWVFAAHTAEVSLPGDYLTVSIGSYRIIVIRDNSGEVGVLHNVCRHRGSIICTEASGSVKQRLTCPYHQWSYALDGTFARGRSTPEDFDPSEHGLKRVHSKITSGMIFVSLAEDPPDFAPMQSLLDSYLAPFALDRAQIAATSVTVEVANWKLILENNRECLHCRGAHPELCATFPEAPLHTGGYSDVDSSALEQIVAVGESFGLPSRFIASADNQFRAMRMPFLGDARSMTMDGEPAVATRFGSLPEVNIGDVLLYHYPSTWNHFTADHAITFRVVPLGPTTTQLTTTWLVPEGAVEGVDYDLAALTSVWLATNAQDAQLVERAQLGVMSPAYSPGPYAPVDELGVIQFVDWYAEQMLANAG